MVTQEAFEKERLHWEAEHARVGEYTKRERRLLLEAFSRNRRKAAAPPPKPKQWKFKPRAPPCFSKPRTPSKTDDCEWLHEKLRRLRHLEKAWRERNEMALRAVCRRHCMEYDTGRLPYADSSTELLELLSKVGCYVDLAIVAVLPRKYLKVESFLKKVLTRLLLGFQLRKQGDAFQQWLEKDWELFYSIDEAPPAPAPAWRRRPGFVLRRRRRRRRTP